MTGNHPVPAEQALNPAVFPASAGRNEAGELVLGAISSSELVQRFGSPLYVLDEDEVRSRAQRIRLAFESAFADVGGRARLFFAAKAMLNLAVARWMLDAGLGIDVASGGELEVALAAGADGQRLLLHGNNKSDDEIARAIEVRVSAVIIDSAEEVSQVASAASAAGVTQRVFLRVNSGVHASTHDYLATSHEDQKFGVTMAEAPQIVAKIRAESSLEFVGLHCHIGSQIFGTAGFVESADRLLDLTARLSEDGVVPEVNLGGGFGVAYTDGDEPDTIEEMASTIAAAVRKRVDGLGIAMPVVNFEPGRWLVANAGVTLYRVGSTKTVPLAADSGANERRYISVDGGMSDNLRPALYGAQYTVRLANRVSERDCVLSRVVGKHCESGDVLVDQAQLPEDVARGDVLVIATTGAYCWSMSSNYNFVTRPAVVAVKAGAARVIVRGETIEDLLLRHVEESTQ